MQQIKYGNKEIHSSLPFSFSGINLQTWNQFYDNLANINEIYDTTKL